MVRIVARVLATAGLLLWLPAGLSAQPSDADGDGLPDAWEMAVGLDPHSAASPDGAGDDPDGDGLTNADEYARGSHPRGLHARRLAEGVDNAFFDWRLALANPHATAVHVHVRLLTDKGQWHDLWRVLPGRSRATLTTADVPSLVGSFATTVESDLEIAVDRTIRWLDGRGGHAEVAQAAAARRWFLAEGATGGPFNLFYLIQNPGPDPATVSVTYLRPAPAPPIVESYVVPGGSRTTIWVDRISPDLSETDVSAEFVSDRDIVVERTMYADAPGEPFVAGHASAAVSSTATTWYLAEGATGPFFDMFVLVVNPSTSDARIQVDYLLADGMIVPKEYTVAARSRFTRWVDFEHPWVFNAPVSVRVRSLDDVPIVVERSMWWADGQWYEAHNSPGATTTGTRWLAADGETGGPWATATYVLIANLSAWAAEVKVTLLFEDGTERERLITLAPTSRFNVDVGRDFPEVGDRRFGVLVESVGPRPAELIVERSMYASGPDGRPWDFGTNAAASNLSGPLFTLPDVHLLRGATATEIPTFRHRPGGGTPRFTVTSSAPGTVAATIDAETGQLQLMPGGLPGNATITVTATMPDGGDTSTSFTARLGPGHVIAFAAPTTIGSALFPAVADMNGDGRVEVAGTVNRGAGRLELLDLRAIGLGRIEDLAATRMNRGNQPVDVNGDGRLDLVGWTYLPISDPESRAQLYLAQADGTFAEDPAFAALDIRGYGHTIVTADFDSDGDVDLFMPAYSHNDPREQSYLLLNDGTGRFRDVADQAGVALRNWPVHWKTEGAQAVDFDGDGDLDLFVANHFFFNQGVTDGIPRFVDRRAELGLPLRFDEGLKFLDFDNDGRLDLLQHHPGEGPQLWRFDGARFVLTPLPVSAYDHSYGVNVYDLNNDGFEDITVAAGCCQTRNRILVNLGGSFVEHPPTTLDGVGTDVMSMGDFDGDGRIDIARRTWELTMALNRTPLDGLTSVVLEVLDAAGRPNQYGRVVRVRPRTAPSVTYTRVVDGGSGFLALNQYALLIGTPHAGQLDVAVRFAEGERTFVVATGGRYRLYADGRQTTF